METVPQKMLLRDSQIEPNENVLENTLGKDLFEVYKNLLQIISDEFGFEYEWRFYKDGKAWLFKAVYKKKTIFWLSIWESFIKTSFYFTEKTRSGITDLQINETVKSDFANTDATGKLIPLILNIDRKEQLNDFHKIANYKKNLK